MVICIFILFKIFTLSHEKSSHSNPSKIIKANEDPPTKNNEGKVIIHDKVIAIEECVTVVVIV